MKKNNNHNSERNKLPKNPFWEYRDMRTFRKVPINAQIAYDMAEQVAKCVDADDNLLTVEQIAHKFGTTLNDFKYLVDKFPQMKEAYNYAKSKLGVRREVGALTRKLDGITVERTQPFYCEVSKEMAEWRSSLRNKEDSKSANAELLQEIVARVLEK